MDKWIFAITALFVAWQQPAFDVASIKVVNDVKTAVAMTTTPGGVTFTNVTALDCIAAAYGVKEYQVSGPEWLKSDRYEIAARTGTPASDAQLKLMLQALLADRFKLSLHHETRDLAVYRITATQGAARLRPTQGGSENSLSFQPGPKLAFRNYSMTALAKFLSSLPAVDRPVSDATELPGSFDFEVSVDAPSDNPSAVKQAMLDWPTLFADLGRQLGLKVEARKAPADVLVVDRIEKPTPN